MPIKKGIPEAPLKIYPEKLYKLEELAGVLRCDLRSIYNYRIEGRFNYVLMGDKRYLVSGREINYIIKNGLRPVKAEYRRKAAAIQRTQRAKRKAKAEAKAEDLTITRNRARAKSLRKR